MSGLVAGLDRAMMRALFALPPEQSHHAALRLLGTAAQLPGGLSALRATYAPVRTRPVRAFGLTFPNAVGLAAGYDKNATAWKGLASLGFGHVEIGTVTPLAQPGNPAPRVFRYSDARSLINRLGFPSEGAAAVRARLSQQRPGGAILGVNLGKNKATPLAQAADDYVALVESLADVADYLTINVSSPNTPGLRSLQTGAALRGLIERVLLARDTAKQAREGRSPWSARAVAGVGEAVAGHGGGGPGRCGGCGG